MIDVLSSVADTTETARGTVSWEAGIRVMETTLDTEIQKYDQVYRSHQAQRLPDKVCERRLKGTLWGLT